MSDQFVSQREFDRVCKDYDRQLAQLHADVEALEEQRDEDLKAAADSRDKVLVRRIGAIGAGAGVVAAWVALVELLHAHGH